MKRAPDSGIIGEAALREAATTEMQQLIELVRASIRTAARLREGEWVDIHAIYPDRVVVRRDGRYFGYPYTVGEDNQVTIGVAEEVVVEHKPVKTPAATTVPLREGWFVEAVKGEGEDKPSRFVVRIIRAGLSKNGVNYPPKVLREAAPLFAGKQVFVKPDDEHIRGGGKDFDRLVGRLVEPRFVEATGEIQAVMEVLDSSHVAPKLREAVERGMTDLFGLSIDASGPSKSTGKFREATAITKVASVDLIIEPGAGGQVIRFAEAYQEPDMLREQMLNTIKTHDAARAASLANASDEDVLSAYREAVAASHQPAATGITQEQLQAHTRLVEARADARAKVQASKLPQPAKDRLLTRFAEAAGAEDITAEKVDAAIKAEEDYGNTFRESAPIQGLGSRIEPGEARHVAIGKMLDGLFAGNGSVHSFREAYIEITGDINVTGLMRNCDLGRFAESVGVYREAVSAATFSDVLGDSITRRMLELYRSNPLYSDWRDLVDVVPVRDFRTQERGRVGGYGNLPAVAENGPYDALATPADEKATYALSKRGGTETISLEAIANDDVGALRRIPQLLSTAAGRTLYEFVLGFLGTNPVIYDTVALFHATHANLGTAALDATSFAAARLRLQKQAELSSSKRLGLLLRHLYIPADLEQAAYDLFVRNTNNDETFVQSQKPKVHVVPHWTDANNWYATADRSQIPLIELGFYNGQEEPELFVQDNPTQGSLFSNDQIKYKIRHIYSGAVMDFRGFDGSVVA